MEERGDRPLDYLSLAREKQVLVDLKDGTTASGKLLAFDIHLNVVLKDAVFYKVQGATTQRNQAVTLFIRGETVKFVRPGEA